jgi:hypothetical protein
MNPAAYSDLAVVVTYTQGASVPGAYVWAELAELGGSGAASSIDPFAAAVLVVSRTFADAALTKAALAVDSGVPLPTGWRVAESEEEAADLAAADRGASADADSMDVDVVMPGSGGVAVRIPGATSAADAVVQVGLLNFGRIKLGYHSWRNAMSAASLLAVCSPLHAPLLLLSAPNLFFFIALYAISGSPRICLHHRLLWLYEWKSHALCTRRAAACGAVNASG